MFNNSNSDRSRNRTFKLHLAILVIVGFFSFLISLWMSSFYYGYFEIPIFSFPSLTVAFYLLFFSAANYRNSAVILESHGEANEIVLMKKRYSIIAGLIFLFTGIGTLVSSVLLSSYLAAINPYGLSSSFPLISGMLFFFDLIAASAFSFTYQMRLTVSVT